MEPADPPLRADARRNRDQVLEAAREAFAESGFAVPLDTIAARAGVGPGTVYRHFSTKEALFQAVVTARVADLVAEARRRSADTDPGDAFFTFLARLGAEGAAKRDIPDAIALPSPLRNELHDALGVLLTRAQDAGAVRPDISITDLVALLKGLLTSAHDGTEPGRAERILAIVTDGLRVTTPSSTGGMRHHR
jgi:AcrR family transcriptional regulator